MHTNTITAATAAATTNATTATAKLSFIPSQLSAHQNHTQHRTTKTRIKKNSKQG
jgi:hypothetical protein